MILCHRKFCFCPCQEPTQSRRPVTLTSLTFTPQTPSPRIAYKCRHSPRSQPLSPHQPPTLWNASAFALPQSQYSFISSSQRARSFDETRSPSIAVHPDQPQPQPWPWSHHGGFRPTAEHAASHRPGHERAKHAPVDAPDDSTECRPHAPACSDWQRTERCPLRCGCFPAQSSSTAAVGYHEGVQGVSQLPE